MPRPEEKPLRSLFAGLGAAWLIACAPPYCGAPCDAHPDGPGPRYSAVVNQYGSTFGYLEVDTLSLSQAQTEKTSLELLLGEEKGDAIILQALKEREDSAFAFAYDDYSTGGSRFNANGKLRRDAAVENRDRQLPRMIGESQKRELFERYGRVRRRMWVLERRLAVAQAMQGTEGFALPAPDTAWSGFYRADRDSLAAGPDFPSLEACLAWGGEKAEGFRKVAFAFEFECRHGAETVRKKPW